MWRYELMKLSRKPRNCWTSEKANHNSKIPGAKLNGTQIFCQKLPKIWVHLARLSSFSEIPENASHWKFPKMQKKKNIFGWMQSAADLTWNVPPAGNWWRMFCRTSRTDSPCMLAVPDLHVSSFCAWQDSGVKRTLLRIHYTYRLCL